MKININDFKGQQENGLNDYLNLSLFANKRLDNPELLRWVIELKQDDNGNYAQRTDNLTDNASHDIATAIMCLSEENINWAYFGDRAYSVKIFPRYLHPRDVVFYSLKKNGSKLFGRFLCVLKFFHKLTFKKKYDVEYHLTNRKTGKLKKIDNIGFLLAKILRWKEPYQVYEWRAGVPSRMARNAYFLNYRFTEIKRPATSGKFLAWNRIMSEPRRLGRIHYHECLNLMEKTFGFKDILGLFALRYGPDTAVYKYIGPQIEEYIKANKQTFIKHLGIGGDHE